MQSTCQTFIFFIFSKMFAGYFVTFSIFSALPRSFRLLSTLVLLQSNMIRVAAPHTTQTNKLSLDVPVRIDESPEERTRRVWRSADCVCFDVDSTVCQDEAIDEFAQYLGCGDAVANVTRTAMNGNARFRDALAARLEVMNPTYDQLEKYANEAPIKLTPGIKDLIRALHARGTSVFLVSGGFRRIILPVADQLGIDRSKIFANELLFNKNKEYAGFDETEPTSDSGSKDVGKPAVISLLRKRHNFKQVVMVGDGATDLEACPPADAFVGFGGNQIREAVRARAGWFVTDFGDLRKELELNNLTNY